MEAMLLFPVCRANADYTRKLTFDFSLKKEYAEGVNNSGA
jgi:hypothetical protein